MSTEMTFPKKDPNKKWVLTEGHMAQIPAWNAKWIANALDTLAVEVADRRTRPSE